MSINISAATLLNQLNSSGTYTYSTTKRQKVINQPNISTKDNCETISRSIRKLRNIDINTASGKLTAKKQIKKVLDGVEDLIENASENNSYSVKHNLSKINNLFDEYEDELESLGVKRTSKGDFSIDKTKLEKLSDTEAFDTLFGKDSVFSKKLEKYSKSIRTAVKNNTTELLDKTMRSTVKIDNDKISMANSSNALSTYIKSMSTADNELFAATYMSELIQNFNSIFNLNKSALSDSQALISIKELTYSHSDELKNIGIEIDNDDFSIHYSENGEDTLKANYSDAAALFSGDFGKTLNTLSKKLFCDLLDTEKNNIKINTYL